MSLLDDFHHYLADHGVTLTVLDALQHLGCVIPPQADAGGIPAHGKQRSAWDAGCRFDHPNPDYR